MNYLALLKDLRTRRIMENTKIDNKCIEDIIEHTRYAASAINQQVLRYAYFNEEDTTTKIFEETNLVSRHKISYINKPSAFIVVGTSTPQVASTMQGIDIGIVVQIIREAAKIEGYDSICIMSFNKPVINNLVKDEFYSECLIALGKSTQTINITDSNNEVGYYKDENNIHTLNKLTLDKIIVK